MRPSQTSSSITQIENFSLYFSCNKYPTLYSSLRSATLSFSLLLYTPFPVDSFLFFASCHSTSKVKYMWLQILWFSSYLQSRILTILYIHTNILIIDWISVGVFFSFSSSMHLLLEIFLLNYPKVSVENEIYWILFDWAYGNSCPCWYIEFSV